MFPMVSEMEFVMVSQNYLVSLKVLEMDCVMGSVKWLEYYLVFPKEFVMEFVMVLRNYLVSLME